MRYDEAIRWLYGLAPRGIRLELDRMRAALALRGNPERALRVVHVAGTNGKGSVSAMVEASLRAAGHRTGLYTSPHLHRFVERIRIAGREISAREVAERATDIERALRGPGAPELTFFETATLLALEAMRDAKVDVAVLEVGLGGRLDATNVIERPEVTAITRIALDHEALLGTTMAAIAREKAGILKPGIPAVIGVRDRRAKRAIAARARQVGAPATWIDRDFEVVDEARGRFGVRVGQRVVGGLRLSLDGAHQRDNAACAVAALVALEARGFDIGDSAIRRGLARTRWLARLERVRGRPDLLFDAAHNPDGARSLAAYLATVPRTAGPRVLVFGAMRDKDHRAMLSALDAEIDRRVYVAPRTPRAADPRRLARIRPGETAPSGRAALARARRLAGPKGLVVVAGSIYLLSEVRALALHVPAEPVITL